METTSKIRRYAFYSLCIALNLGLGALVSYLKLPIFLDTLGTMLCTILTGIGGGLIVGIVTIVFAALIYSPTIVGYVITAITIVLITHYLNRHGFFQNPWKVIISGLIIGISAAIVSAPITTFIWGGISLTGQDFVTAFIKATGQQLLKSVVLAGLSTDTVDKIISCIVVFYLLKNIPDSFKKSIAKKYE